MVEDIEFIKLPEEETMPDLPIRIKQLKIHKGWLGKKLVEENTLQYRQDGQWYNVPVKYETYYTGEDRGIKFNNGWF